MALLQHDSQKHLKQTAQHKLNWIPIQLNHSVCGIRDGHMSVLSSTLYIPGGEMFCMYCSFLLPALHQPHWIIQASITWKQSRWKYKNKKEGKNHSQSKKVRAQAGLVRKRRCPTCIRGFPWGGQRLPTDCFHKRGKRGWWVDLERGSRDSDLKLTVLRGVGEAGKDRPGKIYRRGWATKIRRWEKCL